MRENEVSLYIAHTVTDRHYVRDEVMPALKYIGIKPVSPFYNIDGQPRVTGPEDVSKMDQGKWDPYDCTIEESRRIVLADIKRIDEADGVLSFINQLSIGKLMEVFYCGYVLRKPVFVVACQKQFARHPWVVYTVDVSGGFIVHDLETLIKRLSELYEDK